MASEQEEENKAAWLLGIETLKIQPYRLPALGPHDVRVRIKALGICGSDVHHFKKKFAGIFNELIGEQCKYHMNRKLRD